MNIPTNYKITKLDSARRYLKTFATSLQDTNEGEIVFELLNLADRIEARVDHLTWDSGWEKRLSELDQWKHESRKVGLDVSEYKQWEADDE